MYHNLLCTHVYPADSLAEVRRKLAEADEEDIRRGNTSHEVPASVFIRNGLEIEERQWVLSNFCTLITRLLPPSL